MSETSTTAIHIVPLRIYLIVALTLLILTAITVAVAQFDFGEWNVVVALTIAGIKAGLVAAIFMHLKYDNKLFLLIFLAALAFLVIFIAFTMLDTLRRGELYAIKAGAIEPMALIYDKYGNPIPLQARQAAEEAAAGSVLSSFQLEHGIGPITEPVELGDLDGVLAARGEKIFASKCASCHKLDERFSGPPLRDVTKRRTPTYILNQILNPKEMVDKHPEGQKLLREYFVYMTFQDVSRDDAYALLEYLQRVATESGP